MSRIRIAKTVQSVVGNLHVDVSDYSYSLFVGCWWKIVGSVASERVARPRVHF